MRKASITLLTQKGFKHNLEFDLKNGVDKRHFNNQRAYYKKLGWKILNETVIYT